MKKSVTLFLTILFLISAITIISSILKTYKKATNTSFEFISQNSKIIQNIQDFFKTTDINQTKKFFNIPIMFSSKEGDFQIKILINPICSININDYLKNNKIDKNIDTLIDFLAYKYELQDSLFFKNLILDAIDKDRTERSPYSEISLQNKKFQDGHIHNLNQLEKIINYYIKKTDDKNIKKIPFEKYFNFKHSQLLKECANENILTLNDKNQTNFNIIKSPEFIKISISYCLKKTYELNLTYNFNQKKVTDIEDNPLY